MAANIHPSDYGGISVMRAQECDAMLGLSEYGEPHTSDTIACMRFLIERRYDGSLSFNCMPTLEARVRHPDIGPEEEV